MPADTVTEVCSAETKNTGTNATTSKDTSRWTRSEPVNHDKSKTRHLIIPVYIFGSMLDDNIHKHVQNYSARYSLGLQ